MTRRTQNSLIALTILLIGACYLATVSPYENWDGDYAQYIRHAINIADGQDYDRIGYVFNPNYPAWPRTYPPVLPLLLAPFYKIWGLNTLVMKQAICLMFLAFLAVLAFLVRRRISFPSLIGVLFIFALHPFLLDFKNTIFSEFPFLLFTYGAMFLIQKFYEKGASGPWFFPGLWIALTIYLSYGTRDIGLLLVPCLLAYEFIHYRHISARTLTAVAACIFLAGLEWLFLHKDGDYTKMMLVADPHALSSSLGHYFRSIYYFWGDDQHPKLQAAIFYSTLFLTLSGFVAHVRQRICMTEIFFAVYTLSALLWPADQGLRYFLPALPLYVFYIFCGVEFWAGKPGQPLLAAIRNVFFIGLLGAVLFNYVSFYRQWDYRAIPEGPDKKESVEFFNFIREKIPREAVFIFSKPPILTMFTGRASSIYQIPVDRDQLWQYIHSIHAGYLIYCQPLSDQKNLGPFIRYYEKDLKPVFMNKDFELFEIAE